MHRENKLAEERIIMLCRWETLEKRGVQTGHGKLGSLYCEFSKVNEILRQRALFSKKKKNAYCNWTDTIPRIQLSCAKINMAHSNDPLGSLWFSGPTLRMSQVLACLWNRTATMFDLIIAYSALEPLMFAVLLKLTLSLLIVKVS